MPNDPEGGNTYLTADDRKPVEASPITDRIKAKAPPNLAVYKDDELHPVLAHVMRLAEMAKSSYQSQFSAMQEKWTRADEYYWMAQKEWRLPDLTRAKVNATTFYRCVRRLADGAYLATFSTEDMPMKFFPDISPFDDSMKKQERSVAVNAMNRLAEFSMRRTKLTDKAKLAYHQVYKYANVIIYTPWDYIIEEKVRYESYDPNEIVPSADPNQPPSFINRDTGEVRPTPHPPELRRSYYDEVIKNELGFYVQPIQACLLDNRIEDLDRQTTFLWRSDMTRPEIWDEARSGRFKNVERITELQKFQQYSWENQPEMTRIVDAAKTTTDSYASEIYERWQCWMLLPEIKYTQNKDGKVTSLEWDQNGRERRYVLEFVGELGNTAVCVRFAESSYPDNGIPFIAAHSHDDDSGFWHRGLAELLEDNMVQEQVAKGQLMDNRTLQNFRPMTRMVGRVRNKDIKITHNTCFEITSADALKQLEVSDISQTIGMTLDYLKGESESVAQVPKFFLGEGIGGRTSATEFSSIRDQGSAPALNDINTLNAQIIGGYLRKLKKYAPTFLDQEIIVPIAQNPADPTPKETIARVFPDDLTADMVLKPVSVKEFDNRTTTRQIFVQLIQGILANPMFQGVINPVGTLVRIFSMFREVVPNPEELIVKNPAVKMALLEYQSQQQIAQEQQGQPSEPPAEGAPPGAGVPSGEATGQGIAAALGASKGA